MVFNDFIKKKGNQGFVSLTKNIENINQNQKKKL